MKIRPETLKRVCQSRYNDPAGNIEWVAGEHPEDEIYQTEVLGNTVQFTVEELVNLQTEPVTMIAEVTSVLILA